MSTENSRYLKRRRHRREKVRKLLAKLTKAHDRQERGKVIDQLWKVNPLMVPKDLK